MLNWGQPMSDNGAKISLTSGENFGVDLFFSFRSPYSYLAIGRLDEWARNEGISMRLRPVLPLAIRNPDFFLKGNPLGPPYVRRDTEKVAAFLGIPFRWPDPDPVVMSFDPIQISEEQPYIHRLTRLGILAEQRGCGLRIAVELSKLIWSGEVTSWIEGDHLESTISRVGLNLTKMESEIEGDLEKFDAAITDNQADQRDAGH